MKSKQKRYLSDSHLRLLTEKLLRDKQHRYYERVRQMWGIESNNEELFIIGIQDWK